MKNTIKLIVVFIMSLFVLPMTFLNLFASVTNYPGGIAAATKAEVTASGLSLINGDIYAANKFYSDGGIVIMHEYFGDIDAASATAYDSPGIATTTLVAGTTTILVADFDTNVKHPRNAVLVVDFAVGVATTTVTGTATITGVNARGVSTTETFTISTNSATGSVAWLSITSIAWTVTAVSGRIDTDNALLKVGSGNKIGLCNNIISSNDILNVIKDASGTVSDDTTYTVDTTYDTIDFGSDSDGTTDSYEVWYKAISR